MGYGANAGGTRGCALALALLFPCVMGCINPLFLDDVKPDANHAPVVVNMRPTPGFARLELNVGQNCGPLFDFFPDLINDADLDVLSVRWTMLIDTGGFEGGVHRTLRDERLVPLEEPLADGRFYVFTSFQVTALTLEAGGVDIEEQTDPQNPVDGQLLELTVSDGGFQPGFGAIPEEGAGVFYMSWPVRITNVPCEAVQ